MQVPDRLALSAKPAGLREVSKNTERIKPKNSYSRYGIHWSLAPKSPDPTDLTPELCEMAKRKGSNRSQRRLRRFHALFEEVEPRIALSGLTFVVTSNADSGDRTLRAAILEADQNPGSTIDFNLKPGSTTINLFSSLPQIFSTVKIDGTSQPGYTGTPLVTVDGAGARGKGTGFDFEAGSVGSAIEGLKITGFAAPASWSAAHRILPLAGARPAREMSFPATPATESPSCPARTRPPEFQGPRKTSPSKETDRHRRDGFISRP